MSTNSDNVASDVAVPTDSDVVVVLIDLDIVNSEVVVVPL